MPYSPSESLKKYLRFLFPGAGEEDIASAANRGERFPFESLAQMVESVSINLSEMTKAQRTANIRQFQAAIGSNARRPKLYVSFQRLLDARKDVDLPPRPAPQKLYPKSEFQHVWYNKPAPPELRETLLREGWEAANEDPRHWVKRK